MRRFFTLCGCLMFGVLSAHAAEDNPGGRIAPTAEAIYAAHQAGKPAVVMATLATYSHDVLELGAALVGAHVHATEKNDDPEERTRFLALLDKVAGHTKHLPGSAALRGEVKRWSSLTEEQWAVELRVCRVGHRLERLLNLGLPHTVLRVAKLHDGLRAKLPPSFLGWRYDRWLSIAYGRLGMQKEARAINRAAGKLAMDHAWFLQAARAYRVAATYSQQLQDIGGIRVDEQRAWDAVLASGDADTIARIGSNIASRRIKLGQYEDVPAVLDRAYTAALKARDPHKMYNVLTLRWNLESDLPGNDPELRVADEHIAYATKRGHVAQLQSGLHRRAQVCFAMNRFAPAMESIEKALALKLKKPNPKTRFNLLSLQATLLGVLRENARAKDVVLAMKSLAESQAWRLKVAETQLQLAQIHFNLKEMDQAEAAANKALALLKPDDVTELRGRSLIHLGQLAEIQERWDLAEAHYDRAMESFRPLPSKTYLRSARIVRAGLDVHRGKPKEALAQLRALRDEPAEIEGSIGVIDEMFTQAAIASGLFREGLEAAKSAATFQIESYEGLPPGTAMNRQWRTSRLARLGLEAVHALLRGAKGDDVAQIKADGYWLFEVGRATQLTQALHTLKAHVRLPDELAKADRESRARLRRAQRRVVSLRRLRRGGDEAAGAASDLEAAWTARNVVVSAIAKHSRRSAMVSRIRPAELSVFQTTLDKHTAYVAYDTSFADAISVMIIDSESVTFHRLDSNDGLIDLVMAYRRRLSTPGAKSDSLATQLYTRLVKPLEVTLKGKTHLLISPDGSLATLPFEALIRADGQRVLSSYAVSFVPSVTAAMTLRTSASRGEGFFAVANPPSTGTFPELPASESEVANIRQYFEDESTTVLTRDETTVTRVANDYAEATRPWRVAHFACHGVLNAKRADASGLVLADDAVWSASAIATTKVDADLVVLSACNSARGVPTWGEGLLGLSRAFLWSGARRVIASAWRVEDKATARFFERFYDAHLGRGLSPMDALRAAKLEAIAAKDVDASPACWAAFLLWG